MGNVPLLKLPKTLAAERIIVGLCLAASVIGAGFVFFGAALNGGPSRQVTLDSPGLQGTYLTAARTVGEFLTEVGIGYSPDDLVQPPPRTPIRPGLKVTYAAAKRVLLADAGMSAREIVCTGETVCDLLDQYGLDCGPMDRVTPNPSSLLKDGMRIEITRVKVLDVTERKEIPPSLDIQPDPNLPRGRMVEVSPGSPGQAEEITRYYYKNGQQTARIEMGSRVVVEPTRRVARVGVRSLPPLPSRGGIDRRVLIMEATAYDPGPLSCGPYADGRTATGHIATRGVCAVDPRVIPLGTELWIEGYGYALACDTGGAIKGNRIDVCFDDRAEALRWGRKTVLVYVLE